jgi:hypothetical protein
MSEFARAVIELPVAPERAQVEREAKRLFHANRSKLRDQILDDEQLPHTYRLIGRAIADGLNYRTGYAWPSQEFLARKVLCSARTVKRAIAMLVDEQSGWFRRQLDGRNNCYFPRFDRLDTGHDRGHSRPEIGATNGVTGGPLSSIIDPIEKENLPTAREEATAPLHDRRKPPARMDDRRKVVDLSNLDEIITTAARAEGNCAFVFLNSQPWHLWNEHRLSQGLPPLRPRQHHKNGLLRAGADVPTLYPPGYGRHSTPRDAR